MIGTLTPSNESVWVSLDKRYPMGDQPGYPIVAQAGRYAFVNG